MPAPASSHLILIKFPPAVQTDPSYSSVIFVAFIGAAASPPAAKPAFYVPAPAKPLLPVIIAPPVAHVLPLYSSVQLTVTKPGTEDPPKAKDAF